MYIIYILYIYNIHYIYIMYTHTHTHTYIYIYIYIYISLYRNFWCKMFKASIKKSRWWPSMVIGVKQVHGLQRRFHSGTKRHKLSHSELRVARFIKVTVIEKASSKDTEKDRRVPTSWTLAGFYIPFSWLLRIDIKNTSKCKSSTRPFPKACILR